MTRCSACPGLNTCLPVDGHGDILFIGEAPGKQENQKGRVFIGKTGDEVNRHYLPVAGLRRDGVTFTNAIRCLPITPGGKLDPKRRQDMELLESCATHHLYPLIERSHFKLLVPLGAFACKAVMGDGFDLELRHGIPTESLWGIPAFPMYHPALGIYEPKKMLYIRTDWHRLKLYLRGSLPAREDEWAGKEDYREVTDEDEIQDIDVDRPMGADTESNRKREPFCLTYSQSAGRGRLIRADNTALLRAFQRKLSEFRSPILFHNWFYDWTVTEAMGLHFPYRRIVDTMSRVFHLGNLPQGLKALAYRELGMAMQDFDDLVTPYSSQYVINYYDICRTFNWPKPDEELEQDSKTGLWKIKKPQSMNTKLKRFFTDLKNNPDKDVFKAWENWDRSHAMMEAEFGAWPGKCISHVPFDATLYYACRDADALIRLWPVLQQMRANVRHTMQENWRTA